MKQRVVLAAVVLALAAAPSSPAWAAGPPSRPSAITLAASGPAIGLTPGGGPVHVEADDQDGNRLAPGLFTWAVPAGANIGVQADATGWLLSAPQGAAPGQVAIPVLYNPNQALSPTATVVIGKTITQIRIVVSPP
jgi:hypothetical protein